jgi:hypothetical protein
MLFLPLSSRASGSSSTGENGSSVSTFLSMFLRFHLLYQTRPPTPINKNATYAEALMMIALIKSFMSEVAVGHRQYYMNAIFMVLGGSVGAEAGERAAAVVM